MKKNKFFLFLPLLTIPAIIPCVLITSCSQTLSSTRHFRCSSNTGEWNADLSTPFENDPNFNEKTKEEKIDYINSKLTFSTISDNLIYTMRNWISNTFFYNSQCTELLQWDKTDSLLTTSVYSSKNNHSFTFKSEINFNVNNCRPIYNNKNLPLNNKTTQKITQIRIETSFQEIPDKSIQPGLHISDYTRDMSLPELQNYFLIDSDNAYTDLKLSLWCDKERQSDEVSILNIIKISAYTFKNFDFS